MDSVPVVFITGNVPTRQIGTDSFQEVDITGITIPITKHNIMVKAVSELAETIREAFRIAHTGRPGPVLVDIPRDVQRASCVFEPASDTPKADGKMEIDCSGALEMIAAARRPLILAGGGVIRSGGSEELRRLAEKLGAPVAATLMGIGALPASHPLWLGMAGIHGSAAANRALEQCDMVIAVGTRFSDRVTRAGEDKLRLLHIDIDRSEISKNVRAERYIIGDAREVLERLVGLAGEKDCSEWVKKLKRSRRFSDEEHGSFTPGKILGEIHRAFGNDVYVVTDVGQHQMWTAEHVPFELPGRFITSGGMGTMGFGLGAAVGVQLACPGGRVLLVTGDGSFRMNFGELATAVGLGLPITILILNNSGLGMVRQQQKYGMGGRYSETEIENNPDFAMLATSFGADGYTVKNMTEYGQALERTLEKRCTAVINCIIGRENMVRQKPAEKKNGGRADGKKD